VSAVSGRPPLLVIVQLPADRIAYGGLGRGGLQLQREPGLLALVGRRGGGRRLGVEQASVRGAQEQHRGCPFDVVGSGRPDRLACLGQRRVDRVAPRKRVVETVGEGDRGVVGDLELHADDGGNAVLDEAAGHPGEGIDVRAACSLAGVEDRQAQAAHVMQQHAEVAAGDLVGGVVVVFEHQHAALGALVIGAVPDVMKDVQILAGRQRLIELAQRGALQPGQLHAPLLDQRAQRCLELPALLLDVERLKSARAANHAQDPQRERQRTRWPHRPEVEGSHDRRVDRLGQKARPRVQELPRDLHQFRRPAQPQRHPQAPLVLLGAASSGDVQLADVTPKDGVEQRGAEELGLLHLR
jgi:hypothetical protein